MENSALYFGIIPLIAFVLIDSFMGLKAGLIAAIAFAFLESAASIYWFGGIDWLSILSLLLVLLLAYVSYRKKTAIHFKLQPVVLSIIFGMTFLITYWMGRPIMYSMLVKYQAQLPPQMQALMQDEQYIALLKLSSHYLGYALLLHAGLTAWAAFKMSNWWWVLIRGVGFYGFTILAMLIARYQLS